MQYHNPLQAQACSTSLPSLPIRCSPPSTIPNPLPAAFLNSPHTTSLSAFRFAPPAAHHPLTKAALSPSERNDFEIVWRPPPGERVQQLGAPGACSPLPAATPAWVAPHWTPPHSSLLGTSLPVVVMESPRGSEDEEEGEGEQHAKHQHSHQQQANQQQLNQRQADQQQGKQQHSGVHIAIVSAAGVSAPAVAALPPRAPAQQPSLPAFKPAPCDPLTVQQAVLPPIAPEQPAPSLKASVGEPPFPLTAQQTALARSRAGGWALFNANALAFLYKSLYGREVPVERAVSKRRVRALMPHLSPEQVEEARHVRHSFVAVKRVKAGV